MGSPSAAYNEDEPEDEDVRVALHLRGMSSEPCGLNADWCLRAWFLGPGQANVTSGGHYLLDTEETDEQGRYLFEVVQRSYDEQSEDGGAVTKIIGPGLLTRVLEEWMVKRRVRGNASQDD